MKGQVKTMKQDIKVRLKSNVIQDDFMINTFGNVVQNTPFDLDYMKQHIQTATFNPKYDVAVYVIPTKELNENTCKMCLYCYDSNSMNKLWEIIEDRERVSYES